MNLESITSKATHAFKWSALTEIVTRIASPLVNVILAGLLAPTDFGIVATAMIAISLAQIFWDVGLSKALIQTNENTENLANVVFWINIVLGLALYLFLFVAAPWVGVFFKSPASGPVLRILGLQIVIASLSSVQQAFYVRELDFRQLFRVKILMIVISASFSITLALSGYGVWALVAGALAGQTVNLVFLWHSSHWRPSLQPTFSLPKRFFKFGIWILAEGLLAWFFSWGDSLVVGRYIGIDELGVYQVGLSMVAILYGLWVNPFVPVLFPSLARLQDNKTEFMRVFRKTNQFIMMLVLPIGVSLYLVGSEGALMIFGERWQNLGIVISILGLRTALAWLVGINGEVYRAIGRPDINVKLMVVSVFAYFPIYLWAASRGLSMFLFGYFCTAIIGILVHVVISSRSLHLSPLYLWYDGKNFFLSAFGMGIFLVTIKSGIAAIAPNVSLFLTLITLLTTSAAIYLAMLWFLERAFVVQTIQLIKATVRDQGD